ncbi:hypothetical protein PCASD_12828 [Puccinia coronata f. sp. avenae]|uniref:Uncharacterized protein n=1 Tax=Puccinia coronata f. sp. avenae TaxID=200324 RepID=A0A2N5UWB7_9BASI|nr:hypothetical protein PCASD_12828 [Puccinia coronata f. sp. avenae]
MRRFVLEATIGRFKKASSGHYLTEAPTGCFYEAPSGRISQVAPTGRFLVASSGRFSLPEKLARMVASEFISDATIRFKLGRRATEATEFELVNDSLGGPAPEFESDGCIRYKLGCDHPSQLFWQCLSGSNCWTLPNSIQWAPVGCTGSFWFSLSNGRFEASRLHQGGALEASAGHFYQKASSGLAGFFLETFPMVYWARSQRSSS